MKIKYFTITTGLQLDQALTPRMGPEDSNQLQDLSLQISAYQSIQQDTSFLSSLSSETALNKAGDIQDQWMQASQATLESLGSKSLILPESQCPLWFSPSTKGRALYLRAALCRCITALALSLPRSQDSLQRLHFPGLTSLYSPTASI